MKTEKKPTLQQESKSDSESNDYIELLNDADPNCEHSILEKWSGIVCTKCGGWFCY